MIKSVSVYNKKRIVEMNKPMKKKSIISSSIFSVMFLGLGVFTLVNAIMAGAVFNIVLGSITCLISFYPIYRAVKQADENADKAVKDMGIERYSIKITFVFKDKRIEVTTQQKDEIKNDTILIRNITKARKNKDGLALYLGEKMYYITNADFEEGSVDDVIRILYKNGIEIKGK